MFFFFLLLLLSLSLSLLTIILCCARCSFAKEVERAASENADGRSRVEVAVKCASRVIKNTWVFQGYLDARSGRP